MGYHGFTNAALEASPYKWENNRMPPKDLCVIELGQPVSSVMQNNNEIGCFLVESALSVGGVQFPPSEWLSESFKIVRDHGGLCICDEIQVRERYI